MAILDFCPSLSLLSAWYVGIHITDIYYTVTLLMNLLLIMWCSDLLHGEDNSLCLVSYQSMTLCSCGLTFQVHLLMNVQLGGSNGQSGHSHAYSQSCLVWGSHNCLSPPRWELWGYEGQLCFQQECGHIGRHKGDGGGVTAEDFFLTWNFAAWIQLLNDFLEMSFRCLFHGL